MGYAGDVRCGCVAELEMGNGTAVRGGFCAVVDIPAGVDKADAGGPVEGCFGPGGVGGVAGVTG